MTLNPFRVVVAPGSFKGSLNALDAAEAIARGVRGAGAEAIVLPAADGGEGTLDALIAGAGGTIMGVIARGPLGIPVRAHLGRLSDGTGVVELAQASGLALVSEKERDVMRASSQGAGELLKGALARRPHTVIVGLGDSATCDGGTGLAKGVGVRFLDANGTQLRDGGGALTHLARIDADRLDERIRGARIVAAADVSNPLLGANGAARTFAPQKGATPDQVEALEQGLAVLAERIKLDLGADVAELPGGGAAGGCGAMLAALGATIRSGADVVLETLRFSERIEGANLVITGEGRLDDQTAWGKAPYAVSVRARASGVGCVAIAGSATTRQGFDDVRTLIDHFGDEPEAMKRAAEGLEVIARRIVAEWLRRPL
ncbi:MAG: glycerate kinase [Actinomycetota bacterium]